jgi:CheY-like chemotaxis protein
LNENDFKLERSSGKPCLILEDNPARYSYLIEQLFSITFPYMNKLIVVTTAKDAMDELERLKEFNVIMLDHDLDGQVYVKPENPNTGYQVAKFIREHKIKFDLCIVHTLNEYAVPKMLEVLKDSGKVIYKPCVDL